MCTFTFVNLLQSEFKISYTHQHADFSAAQLADYDLQILLTGRYLTYLICLPEGRVHAIREIKFVEKPDLKAINLVLNQESLLKEKFKSVTWIDASPKFLLVPEEYLRYEAGENLFSELRDPWTTPGKLELDTLDLLRCTIVYEPETDLQRLLENFFPNIQYRHLITKTLYQANRIHQEHQALVTVLLTSHDSFFTMNILNRTGPVLSQLFRAEKAEDYLYYLLWTCQQLHIAPEHMTIWLSGGLHTPTPVLETLTPYFSGVKYLSGITGTAWYSSDSRVPVLHYISLLPELS
jgi:hypothetical protein